MIGAVDGRPIGVFDSGVGGLTVLHELLVTLPHEDVVYLGDNARLPYGPRPLAEIRGFALQIGTHLEREGVKVSLANLRTFPCVQTLEGKGRLDLHGAYFDISSGQLSVLNEATNTFVPL